MSSGNDKVAHGYYGKTEDGECPNCPHLKSQHSSSGCSKCPCTRAF